MKPNIIKNPALAKAVKAGTVDVNQLGQYLLETYPISVICNALAEYIIDDAHVESIPITEEQFYQHFRILGTKRAADGTLVKENRGRKVGTKVVDGKVVKE